VSLQNIDGVTSSVVLSTCNRTEIYAQCTKEDPDILLRWLADFHKIQAQTLTNHSYTHLNEAALNHIMRVASGLDSLILGEPQILGQVKQAVQDAKHHDAMTNQFRKVFDFTFQIAKKVRTETEIGANAVSVAFAAVQLAKQIFAKLHQSRVWLVGAGETIELVAKHLHEQGAKNISVANRTLSKAKVIADAFQGEALTLSQIPSHLVKADIVISSTASQLPIIGKGMVEHALELRRHKPMLFVDIAVPRDIEAEVAELDEAYLYTVDDLQQIVAENKANRKQAAEAAQALISSQITEFAKWQSAQASVDVVKTFREKNLEIRDKLLAKAKQQLADGQAADTVISELAYKLTNQLAHGPTKALGQLSASGDNDVLEQVSQAMGLAGDENPSS
jgi:glutamyl-tRNA reductase